MGKGTCFTPVLYSSHSGQGEPSVGKNGPTIRTEVKACPFDNSFRIRLIFFYYFEQTCSSEQIIYRSRSRLKNLDSGIGIDIWLIEKYYRVFSKTWFLDKSQISMAGFFKTITIFKGSSQESISKVFIYVRFIRPKFALYFKKISFESKIFTLGNFFLKGTPL